MFSATDTLTLASSPWDQKIKIRGWFAFFVCILYTAPSTTHEPCVDGSLMGHIVGSHLSQVSLVFMCQVTLALVWAMCRWYFHVPIVAGSFISQVLMVLAPVKCCFSSPVVSGQASLVLSWANCRWFFNEPIVAGPLLSHVSLVL